MAGEPSVVPFDAEKIAFVTRRAEVLGGLTPATFGAGLLFCGVALPFLHASAAYAMSPVWALVLFTGLQPTSSSFEFDHRYRVTFGHVELPFEFAHLASWTHLWVLLGVTIDSLVIARAPYRWPSSAGIGLAISAALVLMIDGRWRPYYVVPFCSGIVASVMTVSMAPAKYFPSWESDPLRTPVVLLANAFVGLGLVTAGALDHRLLTATLTPFHGVSSMTSAARRRSAGGRTMAAGLVGGCALVTLCVPARHMVLVLPFALVVASASVVFGSIPAVLRRIHRRLGSAGDGIAAPEPFGLHPDTTIMCVLLAAGAVIDAAFLWPAPIASTLVFAFSSLWIALRDWSSRKYYLLGAILPLALLPLAVRLEPARSFTLLLFVCAAALAVESYLDGRGGEPASSASGPEDADTI